jgi:hypothetical protein
MLIVLPFSLVHDLLALALWVLSGFHFGRSMPYSRQKVSKDFVRWYSERVDGDWAHQHAVAVQSNPLRAQATASTAAEDAQVASTI